MEEVADSALLRGFLENTDFETHFSFPVSDIVRLYRAERGDYILSEGGSACNTLYYMVIGRAKLLCSAPNGNISLLDFFKAPCFIGEMELLGVCTETLGVCALEECFLLALPTEGYRERLLSDSRFLRRLCLYLGEKERKKALALVQSHSYPLSNRLADFILLAGSEKGLYREKSTDACAYLGVSYRRLQQVLAEFSRSGYIEKADGGFRILDLAALRRLSDAMNGGTA